MTHSASDSALLLFEDHLGPKNAASLRVVSYLGATLVPLFWILDWLVIPEHVWLTLGLRLGSAAYQAFIVVALSLWPGFVARHLRGLMVSSTLIVGWIIAVMCWLHQGYESPYYAGLNLLIVGAGFLFVWPPRLSAAFFAAVYGFYMAPLLLGLITVQRLGEAVGNQFFLLATMIIMFASQRHRYHMELREFSGNLDLQRTKASLERAVDKLTLLDRAKNQFFNNITHELRTPLTMILAPLDSLLEGEIGRLEQRQKSYLEPIRRNALKLLRLINDLLNIARIEEGRLELRPQRNNLSGVLAEIVEHTGPLAARKEIEVALELRSTAEDLYVDADQMERVVVNLVSNAIKFTDPGGQVTIWSEADPGRVRLGVQDTGVGVPPDQIDRIFERFSQADGSVTRRYGGTGIGLALAKEIVELHGGSITVQSEPGQGSLFVVELPRGKAHLRDRLRESQDDLSGVVEEDGREPREWTQRLLERAEFRFLDIDEATERRLVERTDDTGKSTKVLLVEDNVDVLRFIHLQLQEEHIVYVAVNGAQGLELARRERPDVIVSDYMMPEMDGLTMLNALRRAPETADIPLIMLTAKGDVQTRLSAREAGADVYLSKPFSPKELRGAVRQLLEKRGRQATVVMREQVKSLETISAGLAHELHNPLSYIKNAVFVIGEKVDRIEAAIEDAELAQAQRALLDKSRQQIGRMREVANKGIERIEQVVKLVRRYAREGYPEQPTLMPLDEAVEDVGRLIAPRGSETVETVIELNSGGAAVCCVPEEMQQVIRNLWQNALDAVGEQGGGTVRVSTQREGSDLLLVVSDNGPGIRPEDLRRIFTPFFSTKGPGRGLGIGLAIAQQVVQRAGGLIVAQSTLGQGSTFRVRLPAAEPPTVPASDPEVDRPAAAP